MEKHGPISNSASGLFSVRKPRGPQSLSPQIHKRPQHLWEDSLKHKKIEKIEDEVEETPKSQKKVKVQP
jgi:hypothetical protein